MEHEEHKKESHANVEHHHKVTHHPKAKPNTKLWVMAIALGLLIVVAGVQAIELVGLKNKLNSEVSTLAVSGKSAPTISTGKSSGTLSKNLQNLPTMVGGC